VIARVACGGLEQGRLLCGRERLWGEVGHEAN
jgi:hypothetical protein